MNLDKLTRQLLYIGVAILIFSLGYQIGNHNMNTSGRVNGQANSRNIDFSLFWDTWDELDKKYVDKKKLDTKKMYYGAIKGMVASIEDPYTFFLTPDENKQTKDDLGGKFEGIGAELGLKDNLITIVTPIDNSPALKAGVQAGDIIAKVNNESIEGQSLTQVVSKIRGPKGSKVTLTLIRKGKEVTVTIVRDQIVMSPVKINFESDVAVLQLNKFGDDADREWDKAVDQIVEKWGNKEIKGMVLDLRGNPGGYLQSSVYIASEFIPEGQLVVRQQFSNGDKEDYKVSRQGRLLDIPLTVLIDRGSASASEIVSGALRDYKRATLVGEKSFGKGSVQEALDLDKGAGLHVTIAKWILPKGDWINGKGIEPSVKIENVIKEGNNMTRADDKQLDKAIELITK